MMKTIASLLGLFLTGCALSPAEVRDSGQRVESIAFKSDVQVVAHCVQRNAENQSGSITASVRPLLANPKGAEVVVRGQDAGVLAILELTPTVAGTVRAIGWITPLESNDATHVLNGLLSGC